MSEEDDKIEKILNETNRKKGFRIHWLVRVILFVIFVFRGIYLLTNAGITESNVGVTYSILYAIAHFVIAALCIGTYIAALLSWPIQRIVSGFYGEHDKFTIPPESIFISAEHHKEEGRPEVSLKIYETLMENYPKDPQAYEKAIHLILDSFPEKRELAVNYYKLGVKLFSNDTREELWLKLK